ncbi:thiol-disulfide oxidoreductase DCC family protein [Cellulomonas sp. CW35]|uniref:Thiol-disulfide oxidoreductase n=1 Tax=Cellulomonas uda TaxID=1714 RepID=A0A4Y3KD68_CELUD|nr:MULTISPECIES: DUF393 domain-containing protein [Cellulomonas]NII66268.1 putative DCC family thiol-disulfide oxidoreductase YuxK [Cellulomonas uda]GEA81923.1 hypothetical protein CUD01_23670 [Cellulomonas uda]
MGTTATFLYDGDCGLCERATRWLLERTGSTVRAQAWQGVDLHAYGLTPEQLEAAAVLVEEDGTRRVGHEAFGHALLRAPSRDDRLLGRLVLEQPSAWVASLVYAWVARNRHRLSGSACSLPARG